MSIYFCLVKLVPVEQQAEKRSLYGQMMGWTQGAYFHLKESCLGLSSVLSISSSSFSPSSWVYAYEYLDAYMYNYLK